MIWNFTCTPKDHTYEAIHVKSGALPQEGNYLGLMALSTYPEVMLDFSIVDFIEKGGKDQVSVILCNVVLLILALLSHISHC